MTDGLKFLTAREFVEALDAGALAIGMAVIELCDYAEEMQYQSWTVRRDMFGWWAGLQHVDIDDELVADTLPEAVAALIEMRTREDDHETDPEGGRVNLRQKVIAVAIHDGCEAEWNRRASAGAKAITMHGIDAHRDTAGRIDRVLSLTHPDMIERARQNHVRWKHDAELLEECNRSLCLGARVLLWPNPDDPSYQPMPDVSPVPASREDAG